MSTVVNAQSTSKTPWPPSANSALDSVDLSDIYALIKNEMTLHNELIMRRLHSNIALINQLSKYIIHSGGKRLRPIILLLAARAFGYTGEQHIKLAVIIEFIHTATLLHDDVVDASELRRGKGTANAIWGNEASVLVGDFLYSRAFEMMVEVGDMRILEILSHATNTIAEGEVLQLLHCHDPDTTEERYLNVIQSKTAKLFEAAAQLGGILNKCTEEQADCLAKYGKHLGTAFQLRDDAMDYSETSETIGKNIGDDLAEGKPTLPLIYAMRVGTKTQAQTIRDAIESKGRENIKAVLHAIDTTGAIQYTAHAAEMETESAIQALSGLPDSPYIAALNSLAQFAANRNY